MRNSNQKVMLAVDVVLGAIIGPSPNRIDELIDRARNGESQLVILDLTLVCALQSLEDDDKLNVVRFAKLLQYSEIQHCFEPNNRDEWMPTNSEIDNWRVLALESGSD